jgi:radical SAM protein with 4Fe4S-binding SPASM domain
MFNKVWQKLKLAYSSQPLLRQIMKKLAKTKAYFFFVRQKTKFQSQKDLQGPFNLVLETSNFCPARCSMCPHSSMKRQKGVMDNGVFSKIIERVKRENLPLNKVFFSGLGEPLTDLDIVSRIGVFKQLGFAIKLYTNAFLLTEQISRQLKDLGLDEMNISFNGANPEQYQEIMGLDFQRTKENIEKLLQIRAQNQNHKPVIQISSVLVRENEKDINQHLKNWQDKVESVTVSLAHEWGGGVKIKPKIKKMGQKSKLTYPCRSLWHTFVIDWQGNFVICCRDYESRLVLGNILTHSFADIQKSPILENFRQAHLKFSEEKLPQICRQCNFPYQDGVEWFMPRSLD